MHNSKTSNLNKGIKLLLSTLTIACCASLTPAHADAPQGDKVFVTNPINSKIINTAPIPTQDITAEAAEQGILSATTSAGVSIDNLTTKLTTDTVTFMNNINGTTAASYNQSPQINDSTNPAKTTVVDTLSPALTQLYTPPPANTKISSDPTKLTFAPSTQMAMLNNNLSSLSSNNTLLSYFHIPKAKPPAPADFLAAMLNHTTPVIENKDLIARVINFSSWMTPPTSTNDSDKVKYNWPSSYSPLMDQKTKDGVAQARQAFMRIISGAYEKSPLASLGSISPDVQASDQYKKVKAEYLTMLARRSTALAGLKAAMPKLNLIPGGSNSVNDDPAAGLEDDPTLAQDVTNYSPSDTQKAMLLTLVSIAKDMKKKQENERIALAVESVTSLQLSELARTSLMADAATIKQASASKKINAESNKTGNTSDSDYKKYKHG